MASVYRDLGIDFFSGLANYKVYASSGIASGDICQWDSVSLVATNATLASGSIFLGIAQSDQPLVGLGTSTTPLTGNRVRIKGQGVHNMKSTSGESYTHLNPVYQGADTQTVSKVGSTRMIGRVWLPDGSTVTGGTGNAVPVMIYGNQSLQSNLPSSASTAI